jgi:uncharacterized protein
MEHSDSAAKKTPAGPPATLAGFEDRTRLLVFLNEENLGAYESTWTLGGSFESHGALTVAGQTIETSTTIVPDTEGRWKEIVIRAAVGVRTITREGRAVNRHFKGPSLEQTTTLECAEGAVLFDNDAPALISQALRLYDRHRGGVQKLPVMVGARAAVDLALEAKETVRRAVSGRDLDLTKFLYGLPGLDLHVWADETARIYLVEIPSQNAVMVREGFEALRREEPRDPLLSAPEFEIVMDRGIGVPMRDGVALATDIYRPAGVEKAPVILARTPYKKDLNELQAKFHARRGYVYAVQDCRGRFGSPGVWEPWVNEGRDGYDTIEWLAGRPWSTGKVGMIGPSYLALVQWLAAAERPPHLVTIIPNVSPPDPFHNVPYEYGVFLLWSIWWADALESEATADVSGAAMAMLSRKKYAQLLRALPVVDLDRSVLGKESRYWRRWIEHPTQDAYWEPVAFLDKLENVEIPVFHQSGWFDGDGIGAKLNHARMTAHHHPHQKLTLGPWGHTDTAVRMVGGRDYGESAIIDLQRGYLRWFDRWLKGIDNGIEKEPLVSLFVMGSNRWVHGNAYPLEITTPRKLYLTSGGRANTSRGDRRLSFDPPAAGTPPDHYTYDPGDPTPDPAFYQESEEEEKSVRTADERKAAAEEYRRRISEERQDILAYETDPLQDPMTFVVPISAVLYASTSARDTDWFITLSEVGADGKALRLAIGKLRARYRRSMRAPELLTPGEVYAYTIDLWHTGIRIPPGAKLRVEVASAAFPLCSRNLNTGGHNEMESDHVPAHQAILHDERHPSHILLPVVTEAAEA